MGTLLAYSIIVGLTLLPLFLLYRLWLSRLTFYSLNRIVILGCYAVSLAMPLLLSVVASAGKTTDGMMAVVDIPAIVMPVSQGEVAESVMHTFGIPEALMIVYVVGLMVVLVREVNAWRQMLRVIASGRKLKGPQGFTIVLHERNRVAPFSWGRYIVISECDYTSDINPVILHENMHLRYRHWLDLLLAEAVAVFLWYNPAGWLMRRELQSVHEFQADEAVLKHGVNARDYQLMLIKKAVGTGFPAIANSLDHSNITKRVKMMLRKKSSPVQRWRVFAALPALAVTATLLSAPVASKALQLVSEAKVTIFSADMQEPAENQPVAPMAIAMPGELQTAEEVADIPDKDAVRAADKMPVFPGGNEAMFQKIMDNLIYPPEAMKSGVEGVVVIQFVVTKSGDVGEIKIQRQPSPELGEAAAKAIKTLKFIPGESGGKPVDVWYTVPVQFNLTKGDKAKDDNAKSNAPAKPRAQSSSVDGSKAYTSVEKMPAYPGGEIMLYEYLAKNLRYPPEAMANNIQGTVIVQFVVKADGNVGQIKVVRGKHELLDAEAVRVVKPLKFTPGELNGEPVDVWYTMPLRFKLTGADEQNADKAADSPSDSIK